MPTEESIAQSIEEMGGIPIVEMDVEVYGMTAYPVDKTLSVSGMAADAKKTGDEITNLQSAVQDNAEDIAALENLTGEDIPLNTENNAPMIADAVEAIQAWTASDIPMSSASGANSIATEIGNVNAKTATDILMSSAQGASSIATAIANIIPTLFPVGSIYMTTSATAPTFGGTWTEIAITATWAQLNAGTRGYEALGSGQLGGDVHFWLRTV